MTDFFDFDFFFPTSPDVHHLLPTGGEHNPVESEERRGGK